MLTCAAGFSAVQFVLTAWRRVLNPFQAASITVQSYPGKADILAMIKCAAPLKCQLEFAVSHARSVHIIAIIGSTAMVPAGSSAQFLPASCMHPCFISQAHR